MIFIDNLHGEEDFHNECINCIDSDTEIYSLKVDDDAGIAEIQYYCYNCRQYFTKIIGEV